MARAEVASASLRSDSIKGLAQSIANPAYRRLLTAEPLLRRAVPVLIVAFLAVVAASHFFGMVTEYTRMEASARHTTALSAATAAAVFSDAADMFDGGNVAEAPHARRLRRRIVGAAPRHAHAFAGWRQLRILRWNRGWRR